MGTGRLYDVWTTDYNSNRISKTVNDVAYNNITVGSCPYGICVDKNNTIWVTNCAANTVSKIVNNVVEKTINVGGSPHGICCDKNNNIYVANYGTSTVSKIVNDVVVLTITTGINPEGICCDKNNTIWVANYANKSVTKIVNDSAVKLINISGSPSGICCDKNNNILVATGISVCKINTTTNTVTTINGFDGSYGSFGICCDKNNTIWVANYANNTVSKIINYTLVKNITVGNDPRGICVDKNNTVFVSNNNTYTVSKIVNDIVEKTINGVCASYYNSTGMEWEILFNPEKYLLQSDTTIKTWNGSTFTDVGTSPATDTMFENNGFSDFTGLSKDIINTLSNPKLLTKKSDNNTTNVNYKGIPLPKLVLAKSDITFSDNISKINSFALTATETNTNNNIKIIYSTDSGVTWNAYKSGIAKAINIKDLNDVKTNGMTITEFNAITDWNTLLADKVRFGYYLEATTTTDNVYTDLLTMKVDMNGKWTFCKVNTDYTFNYSDTSNMQVKLLANGDYRITLS